MNEHESHLSTDAPIRQGDIFAWSNWIERGDWDKFGIVITADCDIVHSRSSNFFTYLPILPLNSYIGLVWIKERLAKLTRSHERLVGDEIHRLHLRINPSALRLEPAALHRWIMESADGQIAAALGVSEKKDITNLYKLLTIYRVLVTTAMHSDSREHSTA